MNYDIENGTADFDGLVNFYRSFLPRAELERICSRGTFRWKGRWMCGENFSLLSVSCEDGWMLRPRCQTERVCLIFPTAGAIEVDFGGRRVTATPQSALVAGIHEISQIWAYGRNSRVVLKWEVAAVNKVLAEMFEGARLRNVGLGLQLDLSGPQGQTLYHLASVLSSGVRDDTIRSAKAAGLLGEAALRLLFEQFPPGSLSDQLSRPPDTAMSRQVRAAVNFMHANLHQPLTLGRIAAAVGVSGRSLQAEFQRVLDTSPLSYLRDLRLRAVHVELTRSENFLPVREVALKWGFTHMGRFAAQYREAFGVPPSETSRLAGDEGR